MFTNYRDNLWTVRLPRKREEVVLTTETNRILPRRDFGPSQTASTFHNNELGREQQHTDVVVASSSKFKACWETQQEQTRIQPNPPLDRQTCVGKVYPTPDGRKVWLVTERQLPQGSVPKVIFAALWARVKRTYLRVHKEQIEKSLVAPNLIDEMIQLKIWEL